MQSSELSNSPSSKPHNTETDTPRCGRSIHVWMVWTARIITGAVFMFSGLAKAIDPWGGLYKMADYFAVWGLNPGHEVLLMLACALATAEFLLGAMLAVGAYRRTASWLMLLFMSAMTLLTLYIWIADPVADCGCFGDAFVISNTATFLKNIVLLALAVFLMRSNTLAGSLYSVHVQWIAMVLTLGFIATVQIVGYHVQPLVDFRSYPVGTDLASVVSGQTDDELDGMLFVYAKDGREQQFTADNLPDSTWSFVRRIEPSTSQAINTLSIMDNAEDVTADVIASEGTQIILLVSDAERYGISRSEMANRIYELTDDSEGPAQLDDMIAVVAIPSDSVNSWTARTGAMYPVYTADDTDIKMLARGDAAVVLLRDGVIVWKSNIFAIPPEFPDGNTSINDLIEAQADRKLSTFVIIWLMGMFILLIVSRYGTKMRGHAQTTQSVGDFGKND